MLKLPQALFLAGVLLHVAPVFAAEPAAAPARTIFTNIASVLALSPERAVAEFPVRLEAFVTYANPGSALLFVEDATGGIFVSTEGAMPSLRLGERVEITGRTDPGLRLPTITRARIKPLNELRTLQPPRPDWERLVAGEFDCRHVEVTGVVRNVLTRNGQPTLYIDAGDGRQIEATFLRLRAPTNLWDARVRVRGVCGLRGMLGGKVIAVMIYAWDQRSITIEQPGLSDPFSAPLETIAGAGKRRDRVRLAGHVASQPSGDEFVLQDASGQTLLVQTRAAATLRSNDLVEVSGLPVQESEQWTLRHVLARALAPSRDEATGDIGKPKPLLTQVSAIRQLGDSAAEGFPVRLRGAVTYYDGGWLLFFQDETEGIYLACETNWPGVRAGQMVEVLGFSGRGDYAPIVKPTGIRPLGPASMPQPLAIQPDSISKGHHDSQRVEVRGVIHSLQRENDGVARMELSTPGGRLECFVQLGEEPLPTTWIDSAVRVRAVCGSTFNAHRQFISAQLFVASLNDIIIEEPGPADPFSMAATPITNLLTFGSANPRRVKISGAATFADPRGLLLTVQQGNAGVFVRAQRWGDFKVGDLVEAVGFPSSGSYTPNLTEALVRKRGEGVVPAPRRASAREAMEGPLDARLITMDGRLLDSFARGSNDVLILQAGEVTFEAEMPAQESVAWRAGIAPRSDLRLTGICSVLLNHSSNPRAFKIMLRSPADVTVLRTPPWWNDDRLRLTGIVAGSLIIASIGWVSLLRRKVAEQTGIIRQQLAREQRYSDELEAKVRERTAELSLANKGLANARDQLELRVTERTAELSRANAALREEIAERERSEAALRLTEERFQLVARATNDAVWDWDFAPNVVWWNEAFEKLFGYSRSDITPGVESWTDRIHPEDLERVKAGITAVIKSNALNWSDEYRFRHSDGSYRYVLDRGYVIRDGTGAAVRMVGAMVDMTERRRAEESLRLSEERFSKAFRCSPVPMSITTLAEGRYIDVNDALPRLLGYTREEMLGRTSLELGVWKNLDDRVRVIEALGEGKPVRDWTFDLNTRDGRARRVLASVEVMQIGDQHCLIVILNDISERVQLEEQLRQSQKMEAVGQLAAGIAHDFNNMLTVIQGHVGLMLVDGAREDRRHSLEEVARASERAANLTRQLLTFSRRQPFKPKLLDLNEVIGGMSKMLRRLLGEQVTLEIQHAPLLASVQADESMMEQVLMNLAVNARDAMPEGGKLTFHTSLRRIEEAEARRNSEASPGNFVCVSVTDTGCGMDEATLRRIFEPFFTTKEVGKGTGLGLATVYGIVKQHGGWVEVRSAPGQGTTFEIFLPAKNQTVTSNSGPVQETSVRGGSESILLVEDEAGVRELAHRVLSRYGYKVVAAESGVQALRLWQEHARRFDLLLTDMVMPDGLSGRDLATRLREESPQLKVVYTSGYSVDVNGGEMLLHEGINFLPKPYPARQLAAVVRNCLDV